MTTRRAMALLAVAAVVALWLSLTGGSGTLEITLRVHPTWGVALAGLLAALGVLVFRALRRRLRIQRDTMARVRDRSLAEHHRFLRRLDHELKNPLTAILVAASNIRDECSPAGQDVLNSLETQTLRLSRFVQDLRKLAEIETLPLEEVTFDVRETLAEVVALVQDGEDHCRLTLSVPERSSDALAVRGDPDLLLVAIHNLVDNALKFSRPDDRIALRAYQDGQTVIIQVKDTGRGIPPEDLPLVWEELYRGQNTDGIPGSGIGLALVQLIVKRARGEISLQSLPDQGTTITVRLPEAAR